MKEYCNNYCLLLPAITKMAVGGARNITHMQLIVPACPLKDAPPTVLINLARRIDTVNNNCGFGWIQLADLLGCSADDIRSIRTRADHDSQNSNSPTMILFSDLQNMYNPVFTMMDIERALLELNLEAVSVLHSTRNLQAIERAYHRSIEHNRSIDTNTEPSICNCPNCIHENLNRMKHQQRYNTRNVPPRHSRTPPTDESGQFEPSQSERTPNSRGTLPPLVIPQYRGAVGMGPFTAPPHMQSQEQRNMYISRPFRRQISGPNQTHGINSEAWNTFSERKYPSHGEKTIQKELNNQDVVTSPEDNCQVSDEEGDCTCEISSSEVFHSDFPGNNQGPQQTTQHSECTCYPCSLTDETFVKSSYDQEEIDYSRCTYHSPLNLQNNNVVNPVQTSNEHSNDAVSLASEQIYSRKSSLDRRMSLSQQDVDDEQRNHPSMDNKRNSMDETKTKSFCNGKENSNCNHSLNPHKHRTGLLVFVTYSRDSPEHVEEVIELCTKLKEKGIRVRVDFSGDEALNLFNNKHDWLDANLKIARFVLVCITPTYSEDTAPNCDTEPIPDVNRLDVRYIFDSLRTEYHRNCSQNKRVIPVIFENSGANRTHLPSCMATTIVHSYPRQVDSIIEFILHFSPSA